MGLFQGYKIVLILWGLVLINGCNTGGGHTAKGMKETLEIQILPNTSKMFVYRIRMPEDQIPKHIRIAQSGRETVQETGVDLSSRSYRSLLMNVEYVVKKTGYCREGFLEIDKSLARYHIWMKGECKDGATSEDQQKFGAEKIITAGAWR